MTEPTRRGLPSTDDRPALIEAADCLATRLLDDQRARWERGERFGVEAYRDRYPELAADQETLLDLIYQEVCLRKQGGEPARLEEYQGRFPRLAGPLRRLFEVDGAMDAGPLLDLAATLDAPRPAPDAADGLPGPDTQHPRVPGYEILGELGRGRWGVVYRARQQQLNRVVALKMILAGAHAGAQELARFDVEASAVARFQHPNIVQIYQRGQHAGFPYLELEYVGGGSLEQHLAGTPQPAERAARLVETLARAVHYAHQFGIVHRDLKPANVLLTADGVPKVTDFGLAKLPAEEASGKTRTGDIVGSPSYMAPEQASGHTKEAGPAADVYGLGAILYDLLTGRPPFKAETWVETVRQVVAEDPVPPRHLRPLLPRDLETITLKCLEKDPCQRYADAEQLAEDLRRFLAGESIQARPVSAWERGVKWAHRRPATAALVVVSSLALLGLLGLLTVLWYGAEERAGFVQQVKSIREELEERQGELAELNQAAAAAQQQRRDALVEVRRALYIRDLNLAQKALNDHQIKLLVQLLERHRPPSGEVDVRGFEWHYLWRLCHRERFLLRGHRTSLRAVVFDPEGQTVISIANDGVVKQWEQTTGKELRALPERVGRAHALAYSPDGQLAASGHANGTVRVWSPATGEVRRTIRAHKAAVTALAFSPTGGLLASGGVDEDGTLKLWNVLTGDEEARFQGHRATIHKIVFAPNGRLLATTGEEPTAWVWDVVGRKGKPLQGRNRAWIQAVGFTADSKALILGEAYSAPFPPDGALAVLDLETGKERHRVPVPLGGVWAVALSPDGRLLAWGANSGIVSLWDTRTWQLRERWYGHTDRVHSLAFSPDGQTLASCGNDQIARLWNVNPRPARTTFPMPKGRAHRVAFSPDGRTFAAGGDGGGLLWWDVVTGAELASFAGHTGDVCAVAFSPDGRVLASGSHDRTVILWDLATRTKLATLRGHTGIISAVAFSPDGRVLASGALDGTVRLWDVAERSELGPPLREHQDRVTFVAFAPDGRTLASVDHRSVVRLWSLDTRQARPLPPRGRDLMSLAFSPDGQLLAAGGWDSEVQLWDVARGLHLASLRGHTAAVVPVVFTPDGKTVVSGSLDCTVKFWDVAILQERFTLAGPTRAINGLALSRDGTMLATASSDGTVRLWDATPGLGAER